MNEEQNIKQLPKNWKLVKLGEVAKKKSIKVMASTYPDAKFIGMDCIEPHTLKPFYLYDFKEFKSAGNYFTKNQVLYGRMRPYLNKVYRAEFDGVCSGEFIILDCGELFNPDLLKYILHSRGFVKFANSITTGDRPRISYEEISDYDILLPPKLIQADIVSKIEELFSELDKGIENLRLAQQQLKTYRQSVLKWAFEGKLTNENVKDGDLPKGWKMVLINEIGRIKGGKRLPPKHQYSERPTDFFYIMAGNLKDGTVRNKPTYIKEETYNALANYKVTGGEVYITIVGACIGDAGIIPENIGKSILTENAAKIIELKGIYNKYLALWINSTNCQATIKSKILSATLGKLALNRIGTLEVPLPPIEEQRKIVQEIESRLSVADKMEESITQSLQQTEALRQSILKKAFEGKLV